MEELILFVLECEKGSPKISRKSAAARKFGGWFP